MEINDLKKRGFNLIPLKHEAKEPISGLNWKQFQEEKYEGEFPPTCNVAVICGHTSDNVFVVDLDDKTLYDELPDEMKDTYTVKTGKGQHLYFHYHGFPPPNKKLDDKRGRHIDIKSQGGYILAAGSIHPDTKKPYEIIKDVEIKDIAIITLKDHLEKMGFNVETKPLEDIKDGVSEGGRNDATFKYACYLIREHGVVGDALNIEIGKLNQKHKPPLDQDELDIIISQAKKCESGNAKKQLKQARSVLDQFRQKPVNMTMQEITPEVEGNNIIFDCMITAVGERKTYTKSATYECLDCGKDIDITCDDFYIISPPFCTKHKKAYTVDISTRQTAYIQQLRIQEFLEDSRNSVPIEFDAEIIDENVGEAFIGDRKTVIAKFRSLPKKNDYNQIVFQINEMNDLEQKKGCMPSDEELQSWKDHSNIFERVTASIVPDIMVNLKIIESLILWATGGNSLNGKRELINMAIIGDAQLGKTELLLRMHKILVGSGYTVGRNTSGAGLTIGMVKLYNGVMIPKGGFFPMHTGHPCIIDEGDKMKIEDHNSCLEVMEQQTTTLTKVGVPSLTLPTKCPLLFAGNPKNGKFNPKYPSVMDNFNMETPFVSRFDQLWLLVDDNDPEIDKVTRKFIRTFQSRKQEYMQIDELQRFFTYVKTLDATIPEELMDKIDELHIKIRPLNVGSGLPIGWRQYHGIYRLVTACAKAHLRTVATQEDFDLVETLIKDALKSMKMDVDTGKIDSFTKQKATKENIFLETWSEMMDEHNTVDREDFIEKLGSILPYNSLNAGIEFNKLLDAGRIELDNDTERFRLVSR